jgi:hypothetical protein
MIRRPPSRPKRAPLVRATPQATLPRPCQTNAPRRRACGRLAYTALSLDHRQRPRFDEQMWRSSMAVILCLLVAGQAVAACGDRGGPGYRSQTGRCVGWADIGKTCGSPPSTRCTAENTASGAGTAADLGQKAWDAGKDARKAAGRSD